MKHPFLKPLACSLPLAFSLMSGSVLAKDMLMVAYADPEDSIFGKAATAFSEKLTEVSGGAMNCMLFPNGTLGSINEIPAMLQQGTCDVTLIVTSSLMDLCPEVGVFDLPFLFNGYEDARTTINGPVGEALANKIEEQSMHVGSWLTMGFRETTSSKPISSMADLK